MGGYGRPRECLYLASLEMGSLELLRQIDEGGRTDTFKLWDPPAE